MELTSTAGLAELSTAEQLPALRTHYLQAVHLGSGRAADRVVEAALDLKFTANQLYLDIFQPTAYEIGRLWQRNEFTVAQEHVATAIIEREMRDLHGYFQPQSACGRTLVLGCVEGELHRVGNRMVADFFEQAGWTVFTPDTAVSTETFVAMARDMNADLIGVTAQLVSHVPLVGELVRALERQGLGGIPVIAGGRPFVQHQELHPSLDVKFCAGDAAEAVRRANALFPERT